MDNNSILLSKVSNVLAAVRRGRPFAFTSFLNVEELKFVSDFLSSERVCFTSYGGFEDAERQMICVYDSVHPVHSDFPIVPVAFEISQKVQLSHKDVLGSLMSLGIKRETIGDIIFFDNQAVFFTDNKITEYIVQNLFSVKKFNVDAYIFDGEINFQKTFETISLITSSMRIDCIVSGLANVSRTKSLQFVEGGLVFVNGKECVKKDKLILAGDILSIRKNGKYKISEIVGKTKKDRIKLEVLKYI